MYSSILYQLESHEFHVPTQRWLLTIQENATNEKFTLPASFIADNIKMLRHMSVQANKIINYLASDDARRAEFDDAEDMKSRLFWLDKREDGIDLHEATAAWPVTPFSPTPSYKIITQDYLRDSSEVALTLQSLENEKTLRVMANYLIGDDDFLAKLQVSDVKRIVEMVVGETR